MIVIAVDVGTTSVRLALISFEGEHHRDVNILASACQNIGHHQDGQKFEQNTEEIWSAICACCRICLQKSQVPTESIQSIAFSATCSLVISSKSTLENDVIMWMDHRAIFEAQAITDSGLEVLDQFGGSCSPEFTLAKLVWLQNNQPERLKSASGLFELPDWLVFRCTGEDTASSASSLCCVACKWGYDADRMSHSEIIELIDADVAERIKARPVLAPGTISGFLCFKSAQELGLSQDAKTNGDENTNPLKIVVATSLIDAHSGMLAMLSVPLRSVGINLKIESTFCSLAGTSSCHMLMSRSRNFTKGIWGPYKDVILKNYYLLEAGQSLTGKLIEITIESNCEGKRRLASGERMYDIINSLNELAKSSQPNRNLHILPTFHGNRSPLANPRLKGGVYGLSTDKQASLLDIYCATLESIAYEMRLIVETLGTNLDTILISGGLMKNSLYMQTLANVLNAKVVKMGLSQIDFMVMGSGLLARNAALSHIQNKSPGDALTESCLEELSYPQLLIECFNSDTSEREYHERKYRCYKEFVEFSLKVDKLSDPSNS